MFSICFENSLPFSANLDCGQQTLSVWKSLKFVVWERVNHLPDMPILCSSNSKVNKDIMSKI